MCVYPKSTGCHWERQGTLKMMFQFQLFASMKVKFNTKFHLMVWNNISIIFQTFLSHSFNYNIDNDRLKLMLFTLAWDKCSCTHAEVLYKPIREDWLWNSNKNIVPVTAKYSLTFDNQNGQVISILYWFYTETLNELETIPRPIYYIISLSFFQGVSVATALWCHQQGNVAAAMKLQQLWKRMQKEKATVFALQSTKGFNPSVWIRGCCRQPHTNTVSITGEMLGKEA